MKKTTCVIDNAVQHSSSFWGEHGLSFLVETDHGFVYPNGDQVQPVTIFFECRIVGGELSPDMEESMAARYFSNDELPPMHPCCVAKAGDAFAFQGQAFFR